MLLDPMDCAKMPSRWLSEQYPDKDTRREYRERHILGDILDSIAGFDTFYDARRARLKRRVGELLG